jgi:hypothetical protein
LDIFVFSGSSSGTALALAFLGGFIFLGVPIGCWLGSWLAQREFGEHVHGPLIKHVPKFSEGGDKFMVDLPPQNRVGLCLLFFKSKLLVKQLFLKFELLFEKFLLKSIGQPAGKLHTDECASQPSKQKIVVHKDGESIFRNN